MFADFKQEHGLQKRRPNTVFEEPHSEDSLEEGLTVFTSLQRVPLQSLPPKRVDAAAIRAWARKCTGQKIDGFVVVSELQIWFENRPIYKSGDVAAGSTKTVL